MHNFCEWDNLSINYKIIKLKFYLFEKEVFKRENCTSFTFLGKRTFYLHIISITLF